MDEQTFRVTFADGREELWAGFGADEWSVRAYVLQEGRYKAEDIVAIVEE